LLGFKNGLDSKITCAEKLIRFKNGLNGKTPYTKQLFGFKMDWMKNIFKQKNNTWIKKWIE